MTIRVTNRTGNFLYSFEDPLKVDTNLLFKELESVGFDKMGQTFAITSTGRPTQLHSTQKGLIHVTYDMERHHLAINSREYNSEEVENVESILFKKMQLIKEDFDFVEFNKVALVLTSKSAITQLPKWQNPEIVTFFNGIFSLDFQNFGIRLMSTEKEFDEKTPMNKFKVYHELHITPYVSRPEYYYVQIIIRGGFDHVKNLMNCIDIEDIIQFVEGK